MIPEDIARADIIAAMEKIDEEGVPAAREARAYAVRYQGKLYPPKYVLSLANAMRSGTELSPSAFGGGSETNSYLTKLGFDVAALGQGAETEKAVTITTAAIQSPHKGRPGERLRAGLLASVCEKSPQSDVIVFPAGFFYLRKQKRRSVEAIANDAASVLKTLGSNAVLCFGIDCDNSSDQLALAVTQNGIAAMGRKFYPTAAEKGVIRLAPDCNAGEYEYPRFFTANGKRFYLAVCYDCFGLSHLKLPNPGADAVICLAHRFHPRGDGPSGDVDFARKGFAGASRQWGCPVFGTAVFIERGIPENWPTGVLWPCAEKSVKDFKYQDNLLHYSKRQEARYAAESALCCSYEIK